MAAADEAELAHMVSTAVAIDDRPCAFRYPRGDGVGSRSPSSPRRSRSAGAASCVKALGRHPLVRHPPWRKPEGGRPAGRARYSTTVADARFAKPLDLDLILRLAREHEVLITVEEGAIGGFGAFVLHALAERGALDRGLKIRTLTLPDIFQDHDKPDAMYAQAGLDADGIVRAALSALGVDRAVKGIRA